MLKSLFERVARHWRDASWMSSIPKRSTLTTDFHTACHNRDFKKQPNVHKCIDGTWNFVDPLVQNEKTEKPVIVTGLSCYEAFSRLHELDKNEGHHKPINGSHYSLLSQLEDVAFDPITHKPHSPS